ncbi:TerD family protein [Cellulomonas septica]|uniref:TerD family protein n=1 Tax=Cellulomonas septica TaxID=285080 RepID=A0ABX1K0V7_9CELL|nr:TerD family protein [Cellulomonas septica]NKY39237.1 TerD family protein [Cellulomonas septica]
MHALDRIALDRLGVLAVAVGTVSPARVSVALTELARAGVRITNPGAARDPLADVVADVVTHVRAARGQRGTFAPLFSGFPDRLPSFDDVRLRSAFGLSRLADVAAPTEQQIRVAFDFSDIGWWPASSMPQDVPAALSARRRQKLLKPDSRVQWLDVRLVGVEERDDLLRDWMVTTFASAASVRVDVMDDLRVLVAALGTAHVDSATVRFRELRTLLVRAVWDADLSAVPTLGLTPDDLLRLFADLTGGDVSLTATIRYPRLTRAQRRTVVAVLEASERLSDVFRRRSMWLAVARGLHLAEHDAPRTQEVFGRLRSTKHDTTSLGSRVERLLGTDYAAAVQVLGAEAPGVLVRSLRRLAALADGDGDRVEALAAALKLAVPRVPVRVLLGAQAQIRDNGATYPRVAFAKSGAVLTIDGPQGHLRVADDLAARLVVVLGDGIHTQLAAKDSWAGRTVYVEPATRDILVPDGLRSGAGGLIQVERGSALAVGDARALRLFVHWKHADSDLDLSAIALDADLGVVDQVSWTHLRGGAMVHSGDVTSAPAGAQEFIDIDLRAVQTFVRDRGWRYVAPVVFRYSGVTFDQLEEVAAGWMLRDEVSSEHMSFDPATVANAFPLTGGKRSAVPFVLDLTTGRLVYVDAYLRGAPRARVEQDAGNISFLARAVIARRAIKATMADLAYLNVAARGGVLVDDAASADLSIGLGPDFTYDVLRPQAVLADLL